MALDVTGKLVKLLAKQSGTGSKGNWVKQEFVIETMEQYPKKICISLWGDKVESISNYSPGDEIKVSFNLESREFNERWYTDVRAWKIEPASGGSRGGSSQSSEQYKNYDSPASSSIAGEEEDLPF